jgi:hypothetical protein
MVCRRITTRTNKELIFGGGDARNRDLAGPENAYAATALLCISRAQKSGRHEINRSALKH